MYEHTLATFFKVQSIKRHFKTIKIFVLLCYLGLLTFLSLNPWVRPQSGADFFSWDKIYHILAYAVLTSLGFLVWKRRFALYTKSHLLVWLVVATGSFAVGYLLETAQTLLTYNRVGSAVDNLANGIGAFIIVPIGLVISQAAFLIKERRNLQIIPPVEKVKTPISVLIPTKNEEYNIGPCLESVEWANETIVLDSVSTDKTVEIALKNGARVIERAFDGYSANKNWALRNITFKNDFILIIDADMRVTPELVEEIITEFSVTPKMDGYYIPIANFFDGKWIKHGGWYPNYQLKLFRYATARFENRAVHEHLLLDGSVKYLKNHIMHNDTKGIEDFIERHNKYSSLEAAEAWRTLNSQGKEQLRPSVRLAGPQRRRWIKIFAYRYLPGRALFKFLWMYILRLGFLDGRIGFRYCLLHAFYEYQISLKVEELRDPDSPMFRKYREYLER